MTIEPTRRRFLSWLAAPAIVHAGNLMRVWPPPKALPVVTQWPGAGYTTPPPLTFMGLPVEFDPYCPPDTVYMFARSEMYGSPEVLLTAPDTELTPDTITSLRVAKRKLGNMCACVWTQRQQFKLLGDVEAITHDDIMGFHNVETFEIEGELGGVGSSDPRHDDRRHTMERILDVGITSRKDADQGGGREFRSLPPPALDDESGRGD